MENLGQGKKTFLTCIFLAISAYSTYFLIILDILANNVIQILKWITFSSWNNFTYIFLVFLSSYKRTMKEIDFSSFYFLCRIMIIDFNSKKYMQKWFSWFNNIIFSRIKVGIFLGKKFLSPNYCHLGSRVF